jgi:uncharacterized protein YaeQ
LHRGSKQAGRAAVYTHKDPAQLLAQFEGQKIHKAAEIPIYSFGKGFLESAAKAIERRSTVSVSVTERQLYLEINSQTFTTTIEQRPAG